MDAFYILPIGLIYLLIASYIDIRTREVPDWLNYSLIAAAVGTRGIHSLITSDWTIISHGLAGLALFVLISLAMFYTGQWGGGDAKLLMGMGALLGFDFTWTGTLILFFVLMLVVGAVYGLFWSGYLAIRDHKKVSKEMHRFIKQKHVHKARIIVLVAGFVLIGASFLLSTASAIMTSSLAVLLVGGFYLWIFSKVVEKCCMHKLIPPEKLTEGDWVVKPVKDGKKLVCGPKDLGLEQSQINKLIQMKRKGKLKKVLVKEGIPFVPSFLGAFILAYLVPNLLASLF